MVCLVLFFFFFYCFITCFPGFSGGTVSKESACNSGDLVSIPGWERSPGEGSGIPLQYSCLRNPIDRGAWQVTIHGIEKSQTRLNKPPALLSEDYITIQYLCVS